MDNRHLNRGAQYNHILFPKIFGGGGAAHSHNVFSHRSANTRVCVCVCVCARGCAQIGSGRARLDRSLFGRICFLRAGRRFCLPSRVLPVCITHSYTVWRVQCAHTARPARQSAPARPFGWRRHDSKRAPALQRARLSGAVRRRAAATTIHRRWPSPGRRRRAALLLHNSDGALLYNPRYRLLAPQARALEHNSLSACQMNGNVSAHKRAFLNAHTRYTKLRTKAPVDFARQKCAYQNFLSTG